MFPNPLQKNEQKQENGQTEEEMKMLTEAEVINMMNTLADFQTHKDLLESDKRALLEDVKIPEEVLEIQRAGNNQQDEIERQAAIDGNKVYQDTEARLAQVEIPEEVKAILAEIDAKRAAIRKEESQQKNAILVRANLEKQSIREATEASTRDIYTAVAQRKAEIEAEFSGKAEAVDENIRKLTDEIKAEIVALKKSVKGEHYNAIYVSGRITWNTDKMEAWLNDHPFLKEARKEGQPSVTLRRI
jgi:hypothetical protein